MSTFDRPPRRHGNLAVPVVTVLAVLVLVILVGWAVGLWPAASADDPAAAGSGANGGVTDPGVADPGDLATPTDAVLLGARPSPSGTASSTPWPSSSPSATPSPTPVPEHPVQLETDPEGAEVTMVVGDDDTPRVLGTTPLTASLPEGVVTLTLDHEARQPLTRTITVDGDQHHRWHLDPPGQLHHRVVAFETGSAPKQVAFTPDGDELWVTLLGGPGVAVHDPTTGERLATIDLADHGAVELVFTADGATAYVSQMETASVFEVDTATHQVRRQLSTEGVWTKVLALSPDETRLYASNWVSNDVSEIDLDTGEVTRRFATVTTPRGLYVTPDGGDLYVAGFGAGDLQRIDLATGEAETLVSTGGAMRHLVGDGDEGLLYADDMAGDAVYVHALDSDEVRHLADTDAKPNTIDLSPDGRVLYVSNRGANNPETYYIPGPEWGTVLAFDTRSGEPLDAIVGGNQTTGLDVSDDGTLLAFSDFLDNRVQVYEIPAHDVLAGGDGGRFGAHRDDVAK